MSNFFSRSLFRYFGFLETFVLARQLQWENYWWTANRLESLESIFVKQFWHVCIYIYIFWGYKASQILAYLLDPCSFARPPCAAIPKTGPDSHAVWAEGIEFQEVWPTPRGTKGRVISERTFDKPLISTTWTPWSVGGLFLNNIAWVYFSDLCRVHTEIWLGAPTSFHTINITPNKRAISLYIQIHASSSIPFVAQTMNGCEDWSESMRLPASGSYQNCFWCLCFLRRLSSNVAAYNTHIYIYILYIYIFVSLEGLHAEWR